jgi:hypothetical protein
MGALLDASGRVIQLPTRLLVGRGHTAGLRLMEPFISAEHAVLAARSGAWTLRDLGSANGTYINQERLKPGDDRQLQAGDELGFGPARQAFRLLDSEPPRAFAKRLSDGLEVIGSSEVLGLPSPACPTLQIMPMGAGWVCSGEAGDHPIGDGEVVSIRGEEGRVFLPGFAEETRRPGSSVLLHQLRLTFRVSADEETVLIELRLPRGAALLESRAHNYLLLDLARHRIKDASLPLKDQGWIDRTALASRLHLDPEHLNVQLFRIRRTFAEAGVTDAGNLLECRRRPGQIRIGISALRIEPLDSRGDDA